MSASSFPSFLHPIFRRTAVLSLAGGAMVSCSPEAPPGAGGRQDPAQAEDPAAAVADLKPLTGARGARLVWLEEAPAGGEAPADGGGASRAGAGTGGTAPQASAARRVRVAAYDAADGLGVRYLSGETPDYFVRPQFIDDGSAVVFTRLNLSTDEEGRPAFLPEVFLREWGRTETRSLGKGAAVDAWRDPADGKQYVYALESVVAGSAGQPGRLTGEKLMRFTPDQPADREIVWTATRAGVEQFQLSRDGKRAAGIFPFPKSGLADLTDQTFTALAAGSWPAAAADDSYAAAVLDGSRRRLRFFAPNLDPGWELTFMGAPGWKDGGLLHPRWSNDPGLMVFTGPLADGETAGDVCLVRFREDLRSIESVLQVTRGRRSLSPDLWVEGGATSLTSLPQQPVTAPKPEPRPWPALADELVFAWDNARRTTPLPHAPASLTPGGKAHWGRFFAMDATDGWFQADAAAASAVARGCARSQAWSLELILTERPAAPPVSVRLAALMLEDGREAFALYRVDRKLVLRTLLGGTAERPEAVVHPAVLTNLVIEASRPVHLVLSLRNNRLSCWLDGQMQKEFQLASSGLAAWVSSPGQLIFGDPQPYGSPWSGTLERVAMWSRSLGDDEIRSLAETAAQWVQPRTKPTRYKLKAALAEVPPAPGTAVRTIAPGHAGGGPDPGPVETPAGNKSGPGDPVLGISVWEVKQVHMGQLDAKRIAVAQWSRLNGATLPSGLPAPGQEADLWLESWEDHPELEGLPQAQPAAATGLPLYLLSRP